jgi:hypothetical protein
LNGLRGALAKRRLKSATNSGANALAASMLEIPKELTIVENADHVALYDRMDKVPFDAITDFFAKNLK